MCLMSYILPKRDDWQLKVKVYFTLELNTSYFLSRAVMKMSFFWDIFLLKFMATKLSLILLIKIRQSKD